MSATLTPALGLKHLVTPAPPAVPALQWVTGTIHELLVQPGENFYVFAVRTSAGITNIVRIADPHTGAPLTDVNSDNLIYDTMKEAYFRNLQVEVGYRDFGPDPQSGINKLCIDRVILTQ